MQKRKKYSASHKKGNRKYKLFWRNESKFTKYTCNVHCYKDQFIFFHSTPNMSCNAHAWPSKNNVKFQIQPEKLTLKLDQSVQYLTNTDCMSLVACVSDDRIYSLNQHSSCVTMTTAAQY